MRSRASGDDMHSHRALFAISTLFLWSWSACAKDLHSSDVYSAQHPTVQAVANLGKLIQERTADRHRITMLGADDRHSEIYSISAVRNGSLDMARVNFASLSNILPTAIVPALPYLFRSRDHLRHVLDGSIGRELLDSLDSVGLVGLCFYDTGFRSFYGSKAIRKASDLEGVKLRVPQSGPWVSILKATGMRAIAMPFAQVKAGLASHAIDLAENNWPAFVTSGHYEVAKYYSETEESMTPAVVIMSKRTWREFSPADQAAVRSAAQDSVSYFRQLWELEDGKAKIAAKTRGVEIISDVDKASFVDAATNDYEELAGTPKLRDLIKRIRDTR
jgi:tripartite ATP-independent transporter DctP family solute receptor